MIDERAVAAIEASDTDELIRVVDGYTESRQWETLAALRNRCDEAVTRGKQLWGVSEYIRYRFALDAPGDWAGPAVTEGGTRFTLGPLSEVAASTKTWDDLAPHLAPGPQRAMVAHERVLRGEDLEGEDVDTQVMELPLSLRAWEPTYPLATYKSDRVESATPPRVAPPVDELPEPGETVPDRGGSQALFSVVEHWVDNSNGRAQVAGVEGDAPAAVASLGVNRAGLVEVEPAHALAWVGWAAASGGAYGRRRGAAAGRFNAWWLAHVVAGLEWPPGPEELGNEVRNLRWYLWSDGSPDTGWSLRVAVESAKEGIAWALSAVDAE